jgi:hypothetical protein
MIGSLIFLLPTLVKIDASYRLSEIVDDILKLLARIQARRSDIYD